MLKVMKRPHVPAFLLSILAIVLPLAAQDRGYWNAASSNARAITGDVTINDAKIIISLLNFPIAQT